MGNGFPDEPVYPRLVQGLDQLPGEIKGSELDYSEEIDECAIGLNQVEKARGTDLLLQRLTQRGRLVTAAQLAQGQIEGADGAAVDNGLLDEPVYPRLVQGLDQLAGEIKGGVLDYAEELDDSAVGLDQIEEARGTDLLIQRSTQRGRLLAHVQCAQG